MTHKERALYWAKQKLNGEQGMTALKRQLDESRQSVATLEYEVATLKSTIERSAAMAQEGMSSHQQQLRQRDASLLSAQVEVTSTALIQYIIPVWSNDGDSMQTSLYHYDAHFCHYDVMGETLGRHCGRPSRPASL